MVGRWSRAGSCSGRLRSLAIVFMPQRLIFVKYDGSPCTTRSGERVHSGARPVLVAFGDYDAMRLQQFASEHGGALVESWKLFGAASARRRNDCSYFV